MAEAKKQFSQNEYNKTYYQENKNKKSICVICGGKTSVFNSYQHKNTKKHQDALKKIDSMTPENITKLILEKCKELGINITSNSNSLNDIKIEK